MQLVFKVLVATITVHVFTYTPYMNQLIKQVNQTSFTYRKLDCCLFWLILTVNNVSLKVGTWVGGKALPCTVPEFDMGAFVSLNLIATKQPILMNVLKWYLQSLKKSRFDCSRRAFHLRSRKRYNSENIILTATWTRDLAILVRRSNQLSYEATDVGRWSFVSCNEPVRNG